MIDGDTLYVDRNGSGDLTEPQRVESIYFAVLSRPPRPEEMDRVLKHIQAKGPHSYGDLLWALLNGIEFRT